MHQRKHLHNRNVHHSEDKLNRRHHPGASNRLGAELSLKNLDRRPLRPPLPSRPPPPPGPLAATTASLR